MAGSSPDPHAPTPAPSWPRDLHRAATMLAASGALYWLSYAFQGWTIWIAGGGLIYMDLLMAWIAVLINVAAWPDLWTGLRGLRAFTHRDGSAILAWRAFLCTLVLVSAGLILLPLRYHVESSTNEWLLVLYVSAFPFMAWTFVPILALHGIVFGRVAGYLKPRPRLLADAGALLLFAVAGATTAVVLENPDVAVFFRAWSVAHGLMPALAALGYILIGFSLAPRAIPEPEKPKPTRGWALAKTPRIRLSREHAVYHR